MLTDAHHRSDVGVVIGDGVDIGAGSHQSSDADVSDVMPRLCAITPSSTRPVVDESCTDCFVD